MYRSHPFCHQFAYAVVITTDKRRPLIAGDAPVGNYNRYTCAVRTRDGRFDLLRLVRTDNEQVDTLADKTVDLRTLQLVAAVRNTLVHAYVGVKKQFALHLLVHLLPPSVIKTLADANAVLGLTMAAYTTKQNNSKYKCVSHGYGVDRVICPSLRSLPHAVVR